MKKILLIMLALFVFAGCSSSDNQGTIEEQQKEEIIEEQTKYADDEVVNNFIVKFNELTNEGMVNIEKSNIRTKYFGDYEKYYFEMLDSAETDKIKITIQPNNENRYDGIETMKEVFILTVKSINPSINDEDIEKFFDEANSNMGFAYETKLSNILCTFYPKEYSSRIELEEQ